MPLSSKKSNQTVLSQAFSYRYMYYICFEKSLKISKGLLRQNATAKNKKYMLISYLFCFLSATTEGFTLLHLKKNYSRIAVSVTTQTKDVGLVQSGHNHVACPHHDIAAHLVLKH